MSPQSPDPVLACNIAAIPKEDRPVHEANAKRIFTTAEVLQERPTGYAWRLPNNPDVLETIVAFVRYERLCCPFFRFTLEIEPDQGPLWFQITGDVDMKAFLRSEGLVPSANTSRSDIM
jgi:hypothetical protein